MNRNANHSMSAGQMIGTMNGQQVFGLDIAKEVFQVHTVDMKTGEIINEQLKRAKVLEYFANREACVIGIEACGGAHYWARQLRALGHTVKLIQAAVVRPLQRVLAIPGVGTLTATAVIATMGKASAFKSGREFCAWLGLVPKQTGSGGKVRLGGISKRGDKYVRTLLIHGARAALCRAKEPSTWLVALKARRPTNVAIVAQAAKMARTIWALTAKEQAYQRGHQSVRPAMA